MAVQDAGPAPAEKSSLIYDPKVRGIFYQVVLIVLIIWLGYEIVTNAARNLASQGIAGGFGFLETTAGFSIISLIEYSEESSYGRALVSGLLNTLLVAFIGIIFATILGFIVGVARLSNNWVISQISYWFVEVVRNVPLLLQIFFWYFAVLRAVPNPRNSVEVLPGMAFLNNRGFFMPQPVFGEGGGLIGIAFLVAIAASFILGRWAKNRFEATGQTFPVFWTVIGMLVGLPILALIVTGFPVTFDYPALQGFNFAGGMTGDAGIHGAAGGPDDLHRRVHRRDRPCWHSGRQPRSDRGRLCAWCSAWTDTAADHHPASVAGDHSATH
jgi:general L-amino acid transport system permease protein